LAEKVSGGRAAKLTWLGVPHVNAPLFRDRLSAMAASAQTALASQSRAGQCVRGPVPQVVLSFDMRRGWTFSATLVDKGDSTLLGANPSAAHSSVRADYDTIRDGLALI